MEKAYRRMLDMASASVLASEGERGLHRGFFVTNDGLAVFLSHFGAPAAVMLAEALIASGVKRLIVLGEAGSLSPELQPSCVLLPIHAIREEGTSYHYLPADCKAKPSRRLFANLKTLLHGAEVQYKVGGVWTTDAPFRETPDKVTRFSSRGVLGVEMECSALFTVAKYRKASSAALLVISDTLYDGVWKPYFEDSTFLRTLDKVSELLFRKWQMLL